MSFTNFSGVFGVYEGTKLIESDAYGFANKIRISFFLRALIQACSFLAFTIAIQSARLQSALTMNRQRAFQMLKLLIQ